jgi:dTDP-4-dehydrorhamnose reductase
MKTKIAILGSGMLGSYLEKYFDINYDTSKYFIKMYSQNAVDITDYKAVESIVIEYDYIINCAAYTNVDKAELEPDLCYAVNADAVNNIAKLCKINNKKLVHISTDFVYGGNKNNKKQVYKIHEFDCTNPVNVYGKSKLDGEINVLNNMLDNYLILRVSWTFGVTGNNFIKKIAEQLLDKNKTCIEVVDDQIGRPTSIHLIAKVIDNFIQGHISSKIYNLQNSGEPVSKYGLAKFIGKTLKSKVKIKPCSSDKFLGAKRQYNSYLDCSKLCKELNFDRKDWKEEVFEYLFILYLYPEKVILKKNKQGRLQKLWLMIKNLF